MEIGSDESKAVVVQGDARGCNALRTGCDNSDVPFMVSCTAGFEKRSVKMRGINHITHPLKTVN